MSIKRTLALLVAVCMVFGMMPVTAFAATGGTGTLTLGEPQQVHVENRQDWYYYAFTPEVTGVYRFTGTWASHWDQENYYDVYGALYSSNPETDVNARMVAEDQDCDDDYGFIIDKALAAGQTYYLATTMQYWTDVGSYEVNVTLQECPDFLSSSDSARVSIVGSYNEEDEEYIYDFEQYLFVAPYDGLFAFYSTNDGKDDPCLSVYTEYYGWCGSSDDEGCDWTGEEWGFYYEADLYAGEAIYLSAECADEDGAASYTINSKVVSISSISTGSKSMTHSDESALGKRWKFVPETSGTYVFYSKYPNDDPEQGIEMSGLWCKDHAGFDWSWQYKDNYYFYHEITLMKGGEYTFETYGDGTCTFVIKQTDTFTNIAAGQTRTATISEEGGIDWFQFTPTETAAYTITSNSGKEVWCELYDSTGNWLDFDGVNSLWSSNINETRYFEAGQTYYFRVGYGEWEDIGSFGVTLSKTPTLELDQAQDVTITDANNQVFSFIPEVTALYEFYTVPGTNINSLEHRGSMYERNYGSSQSDLAGEEETGLYMSDVLVAGEQYYMTVSRCNENEGGSFQVCLSMVDITPMELDTQYSDSLTRSGEAATYSFTPEISHTYVIWADWGEEDDYLDIIVYDDNFGHLDTSSWDVEWTGHEYSNEIYLEAGRTYYIDFNQYWDENILGDFNVGITWDHYCGYGICDQCGVELPHTYVSEVTPPTCTAQGYTTYTCEVCGCSYVGDYVAKTEHPFGEWIYYTDYVENCDSDGWQYRECSDCGERVERTIPALGHVPGETVEEGRSEPSCDSDGGYWSKVYCQREECGALLSSEWIVLKAIGHEPGEAVQESYTAPGCEYDGGYYSVVYCQREECGAKLSREWIGISAAGHTPGEPKEENRVEPDCCYYGGYDTVIRCEVCAAVLESVHTELEPLGHSYEVTQIVAPTCYAEGYSVYTCSGCGESYNDDWTDVIPHSYEPAEVVAPSCKGQGYTVYKCTGCDASYQDDYTDMLPHTYKEIEVVAPTCTTDGYTVYECTACYFVYNGNFKNPIDHDYVKTSTVEPTCTSKGYSVYTCSMCGAEEYRDYTALIEHSYKYTETVAPTCAQKGYDLHTCTTCGVTRQDNYVNTIDHTYGEGVVTEPSCAAMGYTTYTCGVCGHKNKTDYTAKLEHSYGEGIVTAPSCTQRGYTTYVCMVCETKYVTDYVPMASHTYGEGEVVEPTCTKGGYTVYACKVCGNEKTDDYTSPLPHEADEGKVTAPTCTNQGYTTYTCVDCGASWVDEHTEMVPHSYGKGTVHAPGCTTWGWTEYVCSVCGEEYLEHDTEPSGHKYSGGICTVCGAEEPECEHDYELKRKFSCEEGGYIYYECSKCGDTYQDSVIPAGHVEGKGTEIVPTCTEEGYYLFCCMECCVLFKDCFTPALGHESVDVPAAQPTCTETGLTAGTKCSRCGEMLVEQQILPANGHTEVVLKAVEATCTKTGTTEGIKCEVCGEILKAPETVPMLGHEVIVDEAVAVSCTMDGLTEGSHCERCGEVLTAQEVIKAPGHTVVVDQGYAATCEKDGLTDGEHCEVCGEMLVEQEVIPAMGHEYGEYICIRCEKLDPDYVPLSGVAGDDITWTFDPETGSLEFFGTGSTWDAEYSWIDYEIETVKDYRVITQLGYEIKQIIFHEGITRIGDCAFYEAYLPGAEFSLPASLTHIGDSAFAYCHTNVIEIPENVISIGRNGLRRVANTHIELPDGLTELSEMVCFRCYELTSIKLPANLEVIGSSAIAECPELTAIEIPDTVKIIKLAAFNYCTALTSLTIPASVEQLGCQLINFAENESEFALEYVKFEGDAPDVIATGNSNDHPFYNTTIYYPGNNETWTAEAMDAIGENVTWIPYCVHVEETVPGKAPTCDEDGMTEGVKCADCGEMLVEQEVIPATGHNYEDHFCAVCGSKEPGYVVLSGKCGDDLYWTIEVEERILRITGTGPMYDGSFINENWENTFKDLENWPEHIIVEEGATTIGDHMMDNIGVIKSVSLPDTLVQIGEAAFFYNTGLTQFNFPDSLRVIEPYAMSFTYITEANLPEGITEIGAYAFFGCHYLADIQLPSTLEVIGNDAFGMIDDLKEITIPANVTTIGSGALSYCESLESVTFEGNAPTVVIADGSQSNFVINDATVYYPGNNETWTAEAMDAIGKNVTWIPYCVHVEETVPGKAPICDEDGMTEGVKCADCGEILVEQEVIPATGHNYEDHFCAVCGSKEPGYVVLSGKCGDDLYWTIDLETQTLRITGTGEMYDGSILDEHYEDTFALLDHEQWPKQLVIEEGATTIGESAFANLDTLETASLPNTLVKIGSRAFVYCFELAEIEIPSGVSEIGEKAFALTAIETISIPEGVTVLAGGTFWECDALTDVSLPSTLKTIGVAAFESCNSLSEIEIPDGVETIESAAFVNCSGLRELVIPASVVELGDCIVSADYTEGFALESITFEGDMPQLTGENEGEYCFYNTTIYYPGDNATWTEEAMAAIGSNVNWVPYYTECQHVERVVAGSAATCTVPGMTIGKICDLCGEVLAEQTVIPALGHTEVPVPGKAPTCIKSGISDGSYCSVCNAVIVEQMTISATGHTKAVDAAVAATCTTAGWTEGAHCSVCNATITMQKKISALGHTEVSVAGTAPTCTASGLSEGTKCSVCDAVLVAQTFIPMLGHNEVSDPAVEATCQDPGLTEGAHCTVCGEVTLAQEETPLGDHLFGNWTNVKMPTVEAEGESRRACVFCGKIETKVLEKLNESFSDVSNDDWYVNEVAWAVSIGVTTGTSADSFSPDNDCTRAQVVTFLWRAAGSPDPASTNNPFTDVVEGAYYYEAVLWAVENGITTGMSSTEFGTDNACTRAQVVTFLCRTAGSPVANQSSNPFADVLATMYYYNAVLWAVEMGITTGMSATSFAPDGICNRAQIVTFLYRYINGTV